MTASKARKFVYDGAAAAKQARAELRRSVDGWKSMLTIVKLDYEGFESAAWDEKDRRDGP